MNPITALNAGMCLLTFTALWMMCYTWLWLGPTNHGKLRMVGCGGVEETVCCYCKVVNIMTTMFFFLWLNLSIILRNTMRAFITLLSRSTGTKIDANQRPNTLMSIKCYDMHLMGESIGAGWQWVISGCIIMASLVSSSWCKWAGKICQRVRSPRIESCSSILTVPCEKMMK